MEIKVIYLPFLIILNDTLDFHSFLRIIFKNSRQLAVSSWQWGETHSLELATIVISTGPICTE